MSDFQADGCAAQLGNSMGFQHLYSLNTGVAVAAEAAVSYQGQLTLVPGCF